MDAATSDMVWGIIARLQGGEGDALTPRAVARIHEIIDQCQPGGFPDTDTQTKQAAWIRERMERDEN